MQETRLVEANHAHFLLNKFIKTTVRRMSVFWANCSGRDAHRIIFIIFLWVHWHPVRPR